MGCIALCVGVTLWFGWGGVVSGCRLKHWCLFNAQHVSDVNTSILRSLRLICWVISWVVLFWYDVCWCYVVVWLGWCGIRMQIVLQPASRYHTTPAKPHRNTNTQNNTTHEITQQISRKLLRMDVLTSETCWAVNWHNKASDIKLVSLYSTIKMMHGPINIKWYTLFECLHNLKELCYVRNI